MYIDRNVIYSDPYKFLICGDMIGYQFPEGCSVEEYDINMDDIKKLGKLAYYNNGRLAEKLVDNGDYRYYKSSIIKKRYSNDDQIAIMLNKDDSEEDNIRYDRMMQWREFAAELSKRIMSNI
jgi:hypothetical protein